MGKVDWDESCLNYLQKQGVEKFAQYSEDFKNRVWKTLEPLSGWENTAADMQLFLETQAALVDSEDEYRDMMRMEVCDLKEFIERLESSL